MKPRWRTFVAVLAFVFLISLSQVAGAQSLSACNATNSLVVGNFGFVLTAGTFIPVTANPPGTTTSAAFQALAVNPPGTNPYSKTQLGQLLSGVAGITAGSVTGIFYFDGAGNIYASQTVGGPLSTAVGTYTVDVNCGILISLGDVFAAQNPKQVTFAGSLVGNASEIDLVPTAQIPTNGGSTTSPIVPPASFLRLVKMPTPTNCTASTLTGPYLLLGNGFQAAGTLATSPATAQYFPFFARVRFDGAGKIIPETTSTASLALLQYVGTYTVNSDCTGTMTISQTPAPSSGATASTPPVKTITAAFLITNSFVQVNSNGLVAFQSVSQLRSSILFSFASQDQIVSGIGTAQ
jgi:hypothetical protein